MSVTARKWVRWNKKMRRAFFDHLAATCNVKAAAGAIGVDPYSVYHLRRQDPRFAEEWSVALQLGYEMMETQLVGHAIQGGGRAITNGDTDTIGPIDVDLALRLLSAHRNALSGKPRRGGPPLKAATTDETDAEILKRLAIIEKRRAQAQ